MDASTLAASALAIANETSQSAAVEELLQERERLAMDREALRSFVVERHYIQAPDFSEDPLWTWKNVFECQADQLQHIRDNNRLMAVRFREGMRIMEDSLNSMDTELDDAVHLSAELRELQPGPAVATRARNRHGGNGGRSRSPRR